MADDKSSASRGYFKPLYPVLMNSSFDRNDMKRRDSDVETERFVRGTVSIYEEENEVRLATCMFSAGEEIKSEEGSPDNILFEVKAEYIIAVRIEGNPNEEELTTWFNDHASSSAWPLFRTYFGFVTTQAASELPSLPLVPDFINSTFVQAEE